MDAVRILNKHGNLTWDYDDEADVLYIAVGEPQAAVGVDVGNGLILRYDAKKHEVVGLTLIGVRGRLLQSIAGTA
jgi:uncharacterized protein YuzE